MVSVNLEPTWCFWMLFHYLPCALSSWWVEKTPLMAFLTSHPYYESSTNNSIISQWVDIPAASSPSFHTQWQTITRDVSMMEESPAQVRCLHNWELTKATEPESPVWDFVLDTPRVSQFPQVAKVTGSWRSRGKLVFHILLASYWLEKTTWPSSALLCDGKRCKSGLYFTGASKENAHLLEG